MLIESVLNRVFQSMFLSKSLCFNENKCWVCHLNPNRICIINICNGHRRLMAVGQKKFQMSHQCHLFKRYIHSFIQMNNRLFEKKRNNDKSLPLKNGEKPYVFVGQRSFVFLAINKLIILFVENSQHNFYEFKTIL